MSEAARVIRPLRRAEYDRLVAAGAFEGERVELLDGQVTRMPPPHGPEHDGTIQFLNKWLLARIGDRAEVRIQSAFAATDDSEPEPDVAVVPPGSYRDAHPTRALWIVEVAVTSIAYDREKAALHARAGVPEYWIVDVARGAVEVHRSPVAGAYEARTTHRPPESLRPLAFADLEVPLDRLLGR